MAPEWVFALTGALLEEVGAGSTVALFFSTISIIHSFYLTNLQNLLSLKYIRDTLPMCRSVLCLLPTTGEPNNLSYDYEQAKQKLLEVQAQGSHHVILSFRAFPDYSLSCCLKYVLKTPNFPSLSLSEVTTPELTRSQNILTFKSWNNFIA